MAAHAHVHTPPCTQPHAHKLPHQHAHTSPRREDLKHIKAKLKKVEEKGAKDASKEAKLASEVEELEGAIPRLQARGEEVASKLQVAEKVKGESKCMCVCAGGR
jgi:hypothetical protein